MLLYSFLNNDWCNKIKHAINGIKVLHNILSNYLFLYIIKELKKKKQKDWTKFDEMNLKKNYVSETKLKDHIYIFIMNYRKCRHSFKKTEPELYNLKVGLTPNQNPSDSEAIHSYLLFPFSV